MLKNENYSKQVTHKKKLGVKGYCYPEGKTIMQDDKNFNYSLSNNFLSPPNFYYTGGLNV